MKKFKIKTNLVSGILMGAIALLLLVLMPGQVRVPAFDSGAPSPRIIPGICLGIMLVIGGMAVGSLHKKETAGAEKIKEKTSAVGEKLF